MTKNQISKQTYMYLARRDKKGIKLIAKFRSNKEVISRVGDIKLLNLPRKLEKEIENVVYENRMDWELWIATANSYIDLKKLLKKLGYSELSGDSIPMFLNVKEFSKATDRLPPAPKTMIRRRIR